MVEKANILVRARDAFLMQESDPAIIKGGWHRRGCPQTLPLEVMLDPDELFAVALKNYDGRTIYKCPKCHKERAI